MDPKLKQMLLTAQKSEITEHIIYSKLAKRTKDPKNKKILEQISKDEKKHYGIWKKITEQEVSPNMFKVFLYVMIAKILGITFGLKLMERGEAQAQKNYNEIVKKFPIAKSIEKDEERHEKALLDLLDEEKLQYIGSVVLGLNDALVELTGALAGLTLALQNSKLIATAGLVTGIAASFSMAASEYLSTKSEKQSEKHPLKASVYTGLAYIFTVVFLIFPYLVVANLYAALAWTLVNALIVIVIFTFYMSITKDLSFKKEALEMAAISLGVAAVSFGIGFLIRNLFGIEV